MKHNFFQHQFIINWKILNWKNITQFFVILQEEDPEIRSYNACLWCLLCQEFLHGKMHFVWQTYCLMFCLFYCISVCSTKTDSHVNHLIYISLICFWFKYVMNFLTSIWSNCFSLYLKPYQTFINILLVEEIKGHLRDANYQECIYSVFAKAIA